MTGKSALLFGASGLVGEELLKCLLEADEYDRVIIIVRRDLGVSHSKLQQIVSDFSDLALHADIFAVNDVFCCLGTTAKKTRDQNELKKGKKERRNIVKTQLNLNYPIMGNPYQYFNPGLISFSASAGTP
jgi:nucleoside-diphosphate-sugar epimerase